MARSTSISRVSKCAFDVASIVGWPPEEPKSSVYAPSSCAEKAEESSRGTTELAPDICKPYVDKISRFCLPDRAGGGVW